MGFASLYPSYALCDRIARGEADLQTPELSEHLWQTTLAKLAVDQPNYASYKRELGREGQLAKPSFRDGPKDQTRNLEIPGSSLRDAPE